MTVENVEFVPRCQWKSFQETFGTMWNISHTMAETVADRLKIALEASGKTARAASLDAGLSQEFVHKILTGKSKSPRSDNLAKLAAALGVPLAWLAEGDTPGTAHPKPSTKPDVEPIAAFNMDELRNAMPPNMPVYGTVAASMAVHHEGAFEMESRIVEFVRRPPALMQVPDAYAFYVAGNSMVPAHMPGEVRFVHPYRPPRQGDTVVVQAQYADHHGIEAFLGIYDHVTEEKLFIRKLNPDAMVEFAARYVKAVHRVLTMNEMFGL
ncbi:XRE family transcriptional regulator [Jiella marina]|uniref:XRE family transcriptional regulator n=1 Tax=Jiella sp. LLJ827 TaxID=2917712 RepID=UPI00210073C2|nr:XRE family transcriptional regulator [Jiella sp. LLJ827]MCQ0987525.1 helix-turn-helix domain-containing protein [Jiella sp. LLJ827]